MTFLYPWALLLLLVPALLWLGERVHEKGSAWSAVCDPHLLPFLTVRAEGKSNRHYRFLMLILWIIATFCLAGPAFLKKDIPTASVQSGIVVAVDMSPAMNGEALNQMTRKLYDLIAFQKDATFGLVLADNYAYVGLPMTQDKNIFKNLIPTLKERIMPSIGHNADAAITKAGELLMQGGFKNGQILYITAGVPEAEALLNAAQKSPYPVNVLGVGETGAAHPVLTANGQFWGGKNPTLVSLDSLPTLLGKNYIAATLDERDLKQLIKSNASDKVDIQNIAVPQYQNIGIYGVLVLLVLTALLFRRGVLWCLLFICTATPSYAGFWWREEQEVYQTQMQGIADFNIGQYEKARVQFESLIESDTEALYNLGNTLAHMNKINEAIKTYEEVLKRNPKHADAAYNLEYLKKQQPPESKSADGSASSDSNNDKNNSADASENNSETGNEPQNGDKEMNSDQSTEPTSDKAQKEETRENDGNQEQQVPLTAVPEKQEQSDEQKDSKQPVLSDSTQKQQEWLDKINPDAGRVLRYRLTKQYEAEK